MVNEPEPSVPLEFLSSYYRGEEISMRKIRWQIFGAEGRPQGRILTGWQPEQAPSRLQMPRMPENMQELGLSLSVLALATGIPL